jgi:hypothetical protein
MEKQQPSHKVDDAQVISTPLTSTEILYAWSSTRRKIVE